MYMEQRTEFWRQEQPRSKVKKIDKAPVTTEKMRINNWVSREVDKIDNGNSITLHHMADYSIQFGLFQATLPIKHTEDTQRQTEMQ